MIDLTTITAALSTLQIGVNFLQDHFAKKPDPAAQLKLQEINNSIITLQSNILDLQGRYSTLQTEKDCLEKKLQAVENWSTQTNLCELKEVAAGVYVYALKDTADNSEPAHYLCATCFNNKKKSIIQREGKGMGGTHYICNECKAEITDHSNREIPPKQNPGTGGGEHGWMGS